MHPETLKQARYFLRAIVVANNILIDSNGIEKQVVMGLMAQNAYCTEIINAGIAKGRLRKSSLKSLENEFFTYWNEYIGLAIESFWKEIKKRKLPYLRKSPIMELLAKGRFRRVEQWIDLFNNFENLKKSGFLASLKKADQDRLNELMSKEEEKRYKLIARCLKKGKIAFSNSLKFGESMAFFIRCDLISKYFSEAEYARIMEIWGANRK